MSKLVESARKQLLEEVMDNPMRTYEGVVYVLETRERAHYFVKPKIRRSCGANIRRTELTMNKDNIPKPEGAADSRRRLIEIASKLRGVCEEDWNWINKGKRKENENTLYSARTSCSS